MPVQKVDCIICEKSFTKQGGRRTCSKDCSTDLASKRQEARETKKEQYRASLQRNSDGSRKDDHVYAQGSGYMAMTGPTARSHPSVQNKSFVQVHVMVAYDKYGPGPHECHWCKRAIDWFFRERGTAEVKKIRVDHIDGNHLNNLLENLVVSCNTCNTRRSGKLAVTFAAIQPERSARRGTCSDCDREFNFPGYVGHRRKCKTGEFVPS